MKKINTHKHIYLKDFARNIHKQFANRNSRSVRYISTRQVFQHVVWHNKRHCIETASAACYMEGWVGCKVNSQHAATLHQQHAKYNMQLAPHDSQDNTHKHAMTNSSWS